MCFMSTKKYKSYQKIWIKHNGPIPVDVDGRTFEIHHKDGNHTNNDISNLQCVSLQTHYDIHYSQGDWGACFRMAERMKITPEEKSRLAILNNKKRVENGTHHIGTLAKKRVENGTHHFLGGSSVKERVKNGTHNFQNGGIKEMVLKGTHNTQHLHKCPYCLKIGKGPRMLSNHFENCKLAPYKAI